MCRRLLGMLPLVLGHWMFVSAGYAADDPPYGTPVEPIQVIQPVPAPPGVNYPPVPPSVNYPPTPVRNWVPFLSTMPTEPAPQGRIKGWLYDHHLCCWSHHDSPGCSSFKAEYNFIFGSCRKFYGEPCVPPPAPYPPVPPRPGDPGHPGCGCSW